MVALEQLLALGYTKREIQTLVAKGWLRRVYRSVYAVGIFPPSIKGRWMAAVLACTARDARAALSHAAAAALHDLRTVPGAIDVTATGRHSVPGVRSHRARVLDPEDVTVVEGIPVTTVARLLLDQAEALSAQKLRTLLEATLHRNLFDLNAINATIARNPGRHGIAPLLRAIGELPDESPWTQSEKERQFLEFIRARGLPEPSCNVVVNGEVVDFYWPAARLIVEVDGWDSHKRRGSFEDDRRKDAKHHVAGSQVLRYTAQRIDREPRAVEGEIRTMLRRGSAGAAA
jgi:very-short-patch-repair endonuclease